MNRRHFLHLLLCSGFRKHEIKVPQIPWPDCNQRFAKYSFPAIFLSFYTDPHCHRPMP